MGFWRGTRTVLGSIINVRVDEWLGWNQLKHSVSEIAQTAQSLFIPAKANRTETFEEALQRLNLNEVALLTKLKQHHRFVMLYIAKALIVFTYGVFIAAVKHNLFGFFMCISLTLYCFSRAFFYHFWIFQINKRQLGCRFKDWLNYYLGLKI